MPFAYYSSTQQKKFSLCPRRYFYHYFTDEREEIGVPAIYSRAVLHPGMQAVHGENSGRLEEFLRECWEVYIQEVGFVGSAHAVCTLPLAEKVVMKYARLAQAWGREGWKCTGREREFVLVPPLTQHTSYKTRVDVVLERDGLLVPVEFKFTTSRYGFDSQLWAYDPQIVGHAVCVPSADVWIVEVAASEPKKSLGAVVDVVVKPVSVGRVQREEWLWERIEEVTRRDSYEESGKWQRVTGACRAFGRPCPYIERCLGNG